MLHLSAGQWVFYGVLSIVWAFLGYRLSENDRRMLGRTPWGLPSMVWAFFWFLSLVLGLILYLIAHSTGVRQAQRNSSFPGAPGAGPPPTMARTPTGKAPTASDLFPAYPRPANSRPSGVEEPDPEPQDASAAVHAEGAEATERRHRPQLDDLTAGLASRPQRKVPLSVVGRHAVDVAGFE